jgi:2-succinyl-5-enolpyruvyl-6-hydroxy-3-cyclohexene-1-carboxylate synthase
MSRMLVRGVLGACFGRGIDEYVVCAGARNAALVVALLRAEGVRVWAHFEERSAGFFALGRTMVTGRPCAVVTTSGTAVAELLPAVIEAHYQGRPLVVVSADRPAGYRGSGAPQAIQQPGIFGNYVGGSNDITGELAEGLFGGWNGRCPWHLNVCLGEMGEADAPLGQPLEFVPQRTPFETAGLATFLRKDVFRGLVVMLGGLDTQDCEEVFHFLVQLGAPVVADAASGLREALGRLVLTDGDLLLANNPPAKILRLGDVPVGRFWRDLEDRPEIQVFSVTRSGFSGLARPSAVIVGDVGRVIRGLGSVGEVGDVLDHFPASTRRRAIFDELLEAWPDSEPGLLRTLSGYAATGSGVFLGNSLPVREWGMFAQVQHPYAAVHAARGANGIDGQISTWLGTSADDPGAWGVFGDLTTLYDLAAPALLEQAVKVGRRLVVINNGGGKIFSRVASLRGLGPPEMEVITNAHARSFEAWAAMWQLGYVRVGAAEDFDALDDRPEALVVEVVPDAEQTLGFWRAYEAAGGKG